MGAIQQLLAGYGATSGGGGGPAVTWNPSDKSANISLSSGNLLAAKITDNAQAAVRATLGVDASSAGGRYFEVVMDGGGDSAPYAAVGIGTTTGPALNNFVGSSADSYGFAQDGTKYNNASGAAYGGVYDTGDVVGVLLKNGKLYFRVNGTWQGGGNPAAETGAAFTGLSGTFYPAISLYRFDTADYHRATGRFAAGSFSGSLPSGAAAWEP